MDSQRGNMKGQTEIIIAIIIVVGLLIAYGISQFKLTINKEDLNLTAVTQLPASNITELSNSHTESAFNITTGMFTGNYTFNNTVNFTQNVAFIENQTIFLTQSQTKNITTNSTCIIIYGLTSRLEIC